MAIETLENVPVMETVVSNKTSTFETLRKHLVSSETLQKQAKAAKSQQVLTLYIFASFIYILFYIYIYILAVVPLLQQY